MQGSDVVLYQEVGLNGFQFSYDMISQNLNITVGAVVGPKAYGWADFFITNTGEIFRVYLIECCQPALNFNKTRIIVEGQISSLGGFTGQFVNEQILVLDDMILDQSVTFNNCEIYLGPDAKISIDGYTRIESHNSTSFRPYCSYVWDGIYAADPTVEIEFNDSELTGSGKGFVLLNEVDLQVVNSTFLNNYISFTFFNYSNAGNYTNNSHVNLLGNTFIYNNSLALPIAATSGIDYGMYGTIVPSISPVHIYTEIAFAQIGEQGLAPNTFEIIGIDEAYCIYGLHSELVLENNHFNQVPVAVFLDHSWSFSVGNIFTGIHAKSIVNSRFESKNSSQFFNRNSFFNASVQIDDPTNAIYFSKLGTEMFDNYLFKCEVEINATPLSEPRIWIHDNVFEESDTYINEGITTSITTGLVVEMNQFIKPWTTNTFCLNLKNTNGARVGDNFFEVTPTGPTLGIPYPVFGNGALRLENVPNAQIKSNSFEYRSDCIYGTGNLIGTQFTCNFFYKFDYGMRFVNATIEDQGSPSEGVDNMWFENGAPSVNRIYLESITGFPNPIEWNYHHTGIPIIFHPVFNFTHMDPTALNGSGVGGPASNVFQGHWVSARVSNCFVLHKTQDIFTIESRILDIYPNPTVDFIHFDLPIGAEFSLLSGQGALVFKGDLRPGAQKIDLQEVPPGVYFLQIMSENQRFTEKIVKL